jgi:hypothetical protein
MNYRDAMSIDESRLDREWAGQASTYMELVEHSAAASKVVDELKDRLGVIEADTEERIRRVNDDMKEAAIKAAILLAPAVKDAKAKLNAARHELVLVRGAVDAMDHRKKALENLVQLHLANYRSEPRAKGDTRDVVRKMVDDGQSKAIVDRLNPGPTRRRS